MELITTMEAAKKLGVTRRRILALITSGRLPVQRFGKIYLIREADLKLVENRKVGRPRKAVKE